VITQTSARRALIYVRLSSYRGKSDNSTSPERQEEEARNYASLRGWSVVDVIRDLNVSGSDKGLRLDRPGLLEVRDRWDEADVLIVAKSDRLARNVLDFNLFRKEADAHGVDLVSVAENLDLTTATGRLHANIIQAFAEAEAAAISERTSAAVAYLAREGRHRGGNAAFGWRIVECPDGQGYRLALDPEQAPVLHEAVSRVISGEAVQAVAEDFNSRNLPAPAGQGGKRAKGLAAPEVWTPVALRRLLSRPILRGMQVHRGELVRGADGLPIRPHDALVTDAEWRALQGALDRRSLTMTRSASADLHTAARGLVSCAYCGSRLSAVSQPGKPPVWVCGKRKRLADGSKCPGVVISRARFQDHLFAEAVGRYGHVEGIEITTEIRADDEVAEVEEALDLVAAAIRDTDDDDEADRLMGQRKALRLRLRDLKSRPVLREAAERRTGRTFGQDWTDADETGRAALLASVLAVVTVSKGTRGRHGLDPSRLGLLWQSAEVEARGRVAAGVVYRVPAPVEGDVFDVPV
jgi:site-specific DNA recombinase